MIGRSLPAVANGRFGWVLFGLLLSLLSHVFALAHAAPLPVESFFKKPKYGGAALSPSGRYLAVVTPINDRRNLSVLDLDAGKINVVSSFTDGDIVNIAWQSDDRMVLVLGDLQRGTGEPPRISGIWSVDRDGKEPERLGGGLLRVIPGTDEVLMAARGRSRYSADVYRVDTKTGKRSLLSYESPGHVADWIVDFDGVPRAAIANDIDHDKSAWYVRKNAEAPWQKVEEAVRGRLFSTPLQFSSDGKILYVAARRNSERTAIYEYEVESGKWTGPVISHPERDIDGTSASFIVDLWTRKLLGLRYQDDRPGVVWFDSEWATMQKSIDSVLPDTVNLLQRRGDRWIVIAVSDRNPGDVYLLDGKTLKMEKLFSYEPWIDPTEMAAMQWVHYTSRDGLSIPALLTLPKGSAGKRLPLVVDIHGGPNVPATRWRYDPHVQFLASRGYAVLQPQYRGTYGFGWRFFSAGFRRWGDEMQDDLEDGVKWAVDQGNADPERVCFYGASYGGYAAMWGAIKNAKQIKCAVAFVGVSSIDYLFDNAQTDLSRVAETSTFMVEQIGDPKTERARFKRVNPLDNADKVGVPILLAYGADDRRVPLVHGTDFRRALDKYGKPYEWVLYDHEAHGFSRDENVFDFYGRVERFLARYLNPSPAPTNY